MIVNATNGDDVAIVVGQRDHHAGPRPGRAGADLTGAFAGSDRVTVNALAGDDVVDASGLAANARC